MKAFDTPVSGSAPTGGNRTHGEDQIARRTAYRYLRVAAASADLDGETLNRFDAAALDALIENACPAELRA